MKEKYSWDKLFCHKVFTIYKGKDYYCSQSSMVGQIRNAASQRGVKVTIDDGDTYIIVAVGSAIEPEILEPLFE